MLVDTLRDISHEAGLAASAIEADLPYHGDGRLTSMLRTIELLARKGMDIFDPAPELRHLVLTDVPF
jgi:hypothetical protein